MPHGASRPLTAPQAALYSRAQLSAHARALLLSVKAFKAGLEALVPLPWLRVFAPEELSVVLSGSGAVSIADWRAHTVYGGAYYDTHPIVEWFWEIVQVRSLIHSFFYFFFYSYSLVSPIPPSIPTGNGLR